MEKRPYETLVGRAQDLSARVCRHKGPSNFEDFVAEHNKLLEDYVASFNHLSADERKSTEGLLYIVKSLIGGVLDVYRVREYKCAPE